MTYVVTPRDLSDRARRRARRTRRATGFALRYLALLPILVFALFPFYWMVRTAVASRTDAFSLDPSILPTSFTLSSFVRVTTNPINPFVTQLINTVIVSLSATLLAMIVGLSGSYALARLRFRGREGLGASVILVQFFPGVLLAIPLYIVLSHLGLSNSIAGLAIAYTTLTLPFTVWILRGYMQSLPVEIEDAARVDGCSYVGLLIRIVVPTIAPALAVVATLAFVNSWNEYLLALILINDADKQVIGVALTTFVTEYGSDYPGLFAMATLVSVPVVLVFLIFQKALIGGLAAGAVK